MLEAGVPIESIAKMMGHSSIASTQIYAQITDQKIAKDMDGLTKNSCQRLPLSHKKDRHR